ncbi:T-cell surface glycoprotein CD8 alpha chain [Epinephelus fuscoguttatus]|uniref:T-cell surface glycoprotein CD8 alpha chain n=1 Tax=Epinephelus fuscoguttatus TaxID=293821 RepID=UPI0020D0FEFB|nr:T-cell surface glycoprotein CD8 alpha chain [Epinephelus fuscoguttatus]
MDQKWIRVLVILLICRQMTSGAGEDVTVKEGQQIDINCKPEGTGTMVIWFRVLNTSTVEFIASFSNTGVLKSSSTSFSSTFSFSQSKQNTLTLKLFNKAKDSGIYNCGSLYRGNELKFGKATRLVGETVKVPAVAPPQATTTQQNLCTTATPCVCSNTNKPGETSPQLFCSLIILGPLAGGCGLLLLLLIATTIYCNQIRTRRCPHHYKRKPRVVAPGKPKMNNRHV